MDRDILHILSEFLPNDVIEEISLINGILINKSNSPSLPKDTQAISKQTETKTLDGTETQQLEEKSGKKEISRKEKTKEAEESTGNKEVVNIEKQTTTKQEKDIPQTIKVEEENYNNIFDFINKNKLAFLTKINLSGRDIRYGFNNFNDIKDLGPLDLSYFVAPLSLTKIEYLLNFYKEVKDVFRGKESNRFLPFPLDGNQGEEILGEIEGVKKLFNLVYILLNGVGKELVYEDLIFNNFKFGNIDNSLYNNPDFYKNFLVKEKSNLKVATISINTKKNAFLKYHLQKLYKSLNDDKSKKIINYINNVLLKDIKAKKYNINISNHKLLQKIFSIIFQIVHGNISLIKTLVEKANDTYEVWLLKELLLYGNFKKYKKTYNDREIMKGEFEKIVKDKIYRIYNKSTNLSIYNFQNEIINGNLFNGNIYVNTDVPVQIKDVEPYSIGFLKEDNVVCSDNKTATFELTSNLTSITKGTIKVTISFGGNSQSFHKSICQINCDKKCKDSQLLCHGICSIIKDHGETLIDILKNGQNQDKGLTPDFIIKVWKNYGNSQQEKLIGTIILDAKFSKFGYIYNGKVDYNPKMGYLEEMKKYFSFNRSIFDNGNLPTKVIILYPGDQSYLSSDFGNQINTYFERVNGIVALPLSLGENKFDNLKSIFDKIDLYIKDIITK